MKTGLGAAMFWMRSVLKAHASIGGEGYPVEPAPLGEAQVPGIALTPISGFDTRAAGASRLMVEAIVQVDIYTAGREIAEAETLAGIIDASLDSINVRQAGPTAEGFRIYDCVREQQFFSDERSESGELLTRIMMTFRVRLQSMV